MSTVSWFCLVQHKENARCFVALHRDKHPGPKTIKKSGAWIGAQLTILCSINRKLRSGDYKEIGVRFLCSV